MRAKWPWALAAAAAAACTTIRLSGYKEPGILEEDVWSVADLQVSTGPARARRPLPSLADKLPVTLYYADLGPDYVDVSDYPVQQKYNYSVFKQECSRCHTLARAVNSPVKSRTYWRFHVARMNLHSRRSRHGPLPENESKAILDFLEYDARVRKVQDSKRFEERTEELKRRFDAVLQGVLERMPKGEQPRP